MPFLPNLYSSRYMVQLPPRRDLGTEGLGQKSSTFFVTFEATLIDSSSPVRSSELTVRTVRRLPRVTVSHSVKAI